MFDQILPQQVDNTYRGYKLALWLFGLLVFMKAGISLGTIFNGYAAASSAESAGAADREALAAAGEFIDAGAPTVK